MQTLIRGTQKKNRQQIRDEPTLKARVSVGGSAATTATIETVRENLPAVIRLVAEILREPAFPDAGSSRSSCC
jgi:zinc protease